MSKDYFFVSLFFIFMMLFGNLMLLNLFLAILLKFISENQGDGDDDHELDGEKAGSAAIEGRDKSPGAGS
jgi:hypothetical protein